MIDFLFFVFEIIPRLHFIVNFAINQVCRSQHIHVEFVFYKNNIWY